MKSTVLKQEEFFEHPAPLRAIETSSPLLQPNQIKKWLHDLPSQNPARNATRIITALTKLQQNDLSDEIRLEALDTYHPYVLNLTKHLQQRYKTGPTPLSLDTTASVDLAQSLIQTLASSYMQLARGQLSRSSSLTDLDRKSRAIERSIFNLGQVLLNGYLAYRTAPSRVWSDLIELYASADRQDLLTHSVPCGAAESVNSFTTIQTTFEQVVLLSTSDPKGMQVGECQHLNDLLTQVHLHSDTDRVETRLESAGVFVFDTTKDEPPLPISACPDLIESPDHVSINCLGTIEALQERAKTNDADQPFKIGVQPTIDTAALVRRVIRRWTGKLTRGPLVRMPQVWDLPVCCGIADIHYYAYNQLPFSKFELDARNTAPIQAGARIDVNEISTATDSHQNSDPELRQITYDNLETQLADDDTPNLHKMQVARVMDESDGGIRLRLFTDSTVQLVVGDIVSMQYGAAGSWRPGVVRWLLANARDHVDVGIQILSNYVEPIAIQPFEVYSGDQMTPALLLPGSSSLGTSDSFVVSGRFRNYSEKCKVVNAEGEVRAFKLIDLKLRTRSFDQITVVPCE